MSDILKRIVEKSIRDIDRISENIERNNEARRLSKMFASLDEADKIILKLNGNTLPSEEEINEKDKSLNNELQAAEANRRLFQGALDEFLKSGSSS